MLIKTRKLVTKQYIDECTEYCCDRLQMAIQAGFIDFSNDDLYAVFNNKDINSKIIYKIKYCPFCGEKMEVKIVDLTTI